MYLELTTNLINNLNQEDKQNLLNIFNSYNYGNHVLAFESRFPDIEELQKYFCEDGASKNTILNISNKHQDSKSLLKKINTYVKLEPSNSEFKKTIVEESNKIIFYVPNNYFDNSLMSTSFVTENSDDAKFYKGLMNRIQADDNFRIIPQNILLNCTNDAGNGSQISNVFTIKTFNEKRITFSICDSDKNNPNDTPKDTATKLKKAFEKHSDNTISNILVLNAREKENLIDPGIYRKHDSFKNYRFLKEITLDENSEETVQKILYLKISANKDETIEFLKIEKGLILGEKEDCSIGKNGLEEIACDLIYTPQYLTEIGKKRKSKYNDIYKTLFNNLNSILFCEYERIAKDFMSWTCSFPRQRLGN